MGKVKWGWEKESRDGTAGKGGRGHRRDIDESRVVGEVQRAHCDAAWIKIGLGPAPHRVRPCTP